MPSAGEATPRVASRRAAAGAGVAASAASSPLSASRVEQPLRLRPAGRRGAARRRRAPPGARRQLRLVGHRHAGEALGLARRGRRCRRSARRAARSARAAGCPRPAGAGSPGPGRAGRGRAAPRPAAPAAAPAPGRCGPWRAPAAPPGPSAPACASAPASSRLAAGLSGSRRARRSASGRPSSRAARKARFSTSGWSGSARSAASRRSAAVRGIGLRGGEAAGQVGAEGAGDRRAPPRAARRARPAAPCGPPAAQAERSAAARRASRRGEAPVASWESVAALPGTAPLEAVRLAVRSPVTRCGCAQASMGRCSFGEIPAATRSRRRRPCPGTARCPLPRPAASPRWCARRPGRAGIGVEPAVASPPTTRQSSHSSSTARRGRVGEHPVPAAGQLRLHPLDAAARAEGLGAAGAAERRLLPSPPRLRRGLGVEVQPRLER